MSPLASLLELNQLIYCWFHLVFFILSLVLQYFSDLKSTFYCPEYTFSFLNWLNFVFVCMSLVLPCVCRQSPASESGGSLQTCGIYLSFVAPLIGISSHLQKFCKTQWSHSYASQTIYLPFLLWQVAMILLS